MSDFWGDLFDTHGGQGDVNDSFGLPRSWQPPEFLGPSRGKGGVDYYKIKTAHLAIYPHGFEREDVPLLMRGVKARVIIADVDAVFLRVREEMGKGLYPNSKKLTAKQAKKAAKFVGVNGVLPKVDLWPSILYHSSSVGYIGGLYRGNVVGCAVWYKTAIAPHTITNWEAYLYHEFGHMIYCWNGVARPELSMALDGRV